MKKILLTLAVAVCCNAAAQNIQVDHATGRAAVSIPLGRVSCGTLDAPISLVYNGGGMKVAEGEGSAGIGWNLSAGGSIERELRGLPDYGASSAVAGLSTGSSPNCSDWGTIDALYTQDTEPDIFHYSAPGLSGSFVFDASGNIKLIPYDDLKIVKTTTGDEISKFEITNNRGVRYVFEAQPAVKRIAYPQAATISDFRREYMLFKSGVTFNSSWSLTHMYSSAGESLQFSYTGSSSNNKGVEPRKVIPSSTVTDLYTIVENVAAPSQPQERHLYNARYRTSIPLSPWLVNRIESTGPG